MTSPCHILQWLPGTPYLVATGGKTYHILNLDKLEINERQLDSTITSVAAPIDCKFVFLGLESGDIITINVSTNTTGPVKIPFPNDEISGGDPAVSHLAINVMNPGLLLASYVASGTTILYELLPRSIFSTYRYGSIVTALAWALSGDAFVAAYDEGKFCYWNVTSSRPKYIWEAPWMHPDQGLTAIHPILGIVPRLLDGSDGSDKTFLVNMGPVLRILRIADGEISVLDELVGTKGIDKVCVLAKSAWWQTDSESVTVKDDRTWEAVVFLNNDGRVEARTWIDPSWTSRIPKLLRPPANLQISQINSLQTYNADEVTANMGLELGHILKGGRFLKPENVVERIPHVAVRTWSYLQFGEWLSDYGVLNFEARWELDLHDAILAANHGESVKSPVSPGSPTPDPVTWWCMSGDGLCLQVAIGDKVLLMFRADCATQSPALRATRVDSKAPAETLDGAAGKQRSTAEVQIPPVQSPPQESVLGSAEATVSGPREEPSGAQESNKEGNDVQEVEEKKVEDGQEASDKGDSLRRSFTAPPAVITDTEQASTPPGPEANKTEGIPRSQSLKTPPSDLVVAPPETSAVPMTVVPDTSEHPFTLEPVPLAAEPQPWIPQFTYSLKSSSHSCMFFSRSLTVAVLEAAEVMLYEDARLLSRMPMQIPFESTRVRGPWAERYCMGTPPRGVTWAGWNEDVFAVVVENLRVYMVAAHGEQRVEVMSKKQPPVPPTKDPIADVAVTQSENGLSAVLLTASALFTFEASLAIQDLCRTITVSDLGFAMVLGTEALHLVQMPGLNVLKKVPLLREPEHPVTGNLLEFGREVTPDGWLVQWTRSGRIRLFDLTSKT